MGHGLGAGFQGGSPPSPILRPCGNPIGISLQFGRTRVIHVIAVITATGERTMNGIPAVTPNAEAGAPVAEPKPAKKPRSAAQNAHGAPSKSKSGNKATAAKKANKGAK